MNVRYLGIFLAASLLAVFRPAMADDTDLFVRASNSSQPPDVLFVIDNAANFSASAPASNNCTLAGSLNSLSGTVGGIEQCALHQVIDALDPDSVNIGIMVYNASNVVDFQGVQCFTIVASKPGGCLVYPMQLMNAPNKTALLAWIRSWKTSGSGAGYIKANSQATGGSMQEAWAYYNGRTGLSGRNYSSTPPPGTCKKYVIFIGNSFTNSGSPGDYSGDTGPGTALDGTNGTPGMNAYPPATPAERLIMNRTITTACGTATLGNPHNNRGYYADEWARYMKAHDITTYTIGVIRVPGCQADYGALLKNMGEGVGGGKYFPTRNTAELVIALRTALSEMISTNSVFASVSLPVSVNTEGYYLNQVFIGQFRPDSNALPRWFGNLKQYRLGRPRDPATGLPLTTGLQLQDSRDPAQPAISPAHTGFIWNCARSYWTPASADTYWTRYTGAFRCEGDPSGTLYPGESNSPDGNAVEKGAQAYKLRGLATAPSISRNMKTCNATCGAIASFDTGNTDITKTLLGNAAMTDTARTDLINWARGMNNRGDEDAVTAVANATAMRPSVHGDVVHSRPVALNYGTDLAPEVVVIYGANDGALRAVNGNRTADIGSVGAGRELWSFMPPEFYSQINRLRDNTQSIAYFGNPVISPAPLPKPYGFDGPVTSDVVQGVGGHKWIFTTMRRGGRAVYAFDVSSLNTDTSSPTLKWKVGCSTMSDDTGCVSGGWTGMGQTWSSPKVIRTAGYGGGTSPMLIMGGGYGGACEDADPMTCTSTSKGSRIYVLDADTGTKLREFDLSSVNGGRGVVADVFVIPDGGTGRAKWAYAVDLGGNVWRIGGAIVSGVPQPFFATAPGSWTITRIASLGCNDVSTTCSNKRKFMTMPDIVDTGVDTGGVYWLLFGSGDREKPLLDYTNAYATTNYFFAIKDAPFDPTWLTSENSRCSADVICRNSLGQIDVATPEVMAAAKGWYLALNLHEQVVTAAITVFGTATFSTHTPEVPVVGSCDSDLGTARVYNVRYYDAAAKPGNVSRSEEIDGGGLPPSPVAGMVTLDEGGAPVPFLIGGSGGSPLEGGEPTAPSSTTLPKSLTYWFIHK